MRSISTSALAIALIGLGSGLPVTTSAVCVIAGDAADLQTQLVNAEGNTSTTVIKVPRGTYHLGGNQLVFNSTAAGQGQFDIGGGYNSDCSTHINNPALTIIDGDGMSGALSLTSTAGISVRYLTIQNGLKAQNAGLDVNVSGGGIIVDYNIIQNNRATDERSALEALIGGGSGNMHIDGNLIVDNSANTNVSGGEVDNLGTGNTYITNNTIANNAITGTLLNGYGGLFVYGNTTPNISNNIFWGNTNLDFDSSSDPVLVDNDYGTIGGNQSSNTGFQSVDPQFVSSSDFHLSASSPLLGQGLCNPEPAGGLPSIDIEGNPRTYDLTYVAATCKVDMGAYEHGDEIFKDGFNN